MTTYIKPNYEPVYGDPFKAFGSLFVGQGMTAVQAGQSFVTTGEVKYTAPRENAKVVRAVTADAYKGSQDYAVQTVRDTTNYISETTGYAIDTISSFLRPSPTLPQSSVADATAALTQGGNTRSGRKYGVDSSASETALAPFGAVPFALTGLAGLPGLPAKVAGMAAGIMYTQAVVGTRQERLLLPGNQLPGVPVPTIVGPRPEPLPANSTQPLLAPPAPAPPLSKPSVQTHRNVNQVRESTRHSKHYEPNVGYQPPIGDHGNVNLADVMRVINSAPGAPGGDDPTATDLDWCCIGKAATAAAATALII